MQGRRRVGMKMFNEFARCVFRRAIDRISPCRLVFTFESGMRNPGGQGTGSGSLGTGAAGFQ